MLKSLNINLFPDFNKYKAMFESLTLHQFEHIVRIPPSSSIKH